MRSESFLKKQELTSQKYNFEVLAELEPSVTELLMELKQDIDDCTYDLLLSDDAGGRILTLIIRKIYKLRHPNGPSLETYFIGAGKDNNAWDELDDLIKDFKARNKNPLVITQYAHTGETVSMFAKKLKQAGIASGLAVLEEGIESNIDELGFCGIYRGAFIGSSLAERHEEFTGVRTLPVDRTPFPVRTDDLHESHGRKITTEIFDEIAGITESDSSEERIAKIRSDETAEKIQTFKHSPFTEEEKRDRQNAINLTRQDINLMANQVYKSIWQEAAR